LVLDLAGHSLDTGSIKLGSGSKLTVTDSSLGTPGTLTALAASGEGAGISVDGGTLLIEGRAVVHATARQSTAAGIGGGYHGAGGHVVLDGGMVTRQTANVQWQLLGVLPHNYLVTFNV